MYGSGLGLMINVVEVMVVGFFFFFKQKTAYEIGTGDWSSDVCSSDLGDYPQLSSADGGDVGGGHPLRPD